MGMRLFCVFVCFGLLSHTAIASTATGRTSGVGQLIEVKPAEYESRVESKLAMLEEKLASAKSDSSIKVVSRQIEQTKAKWVESGDKEVRLLFWDEARSTIYPVEFGIGRQRLRMTPGSFYEMTIEYKLNSKQRVQTSGSFSAAVGAAKKVPLKISRYKEVSMPVGWDAIKISLWRWGLAWIPNLDPSDTYIEAGEVQAGEVSVRTSGGGLIQTPVGPVGHPVTTRVVQLHSVPFTNRSDRIIENASIHCVLKDQNGMEVARSQEGGQFTSWKPGEVRIIKFETDTESIPGLHPDHKVVRLKLEVTAP